MRFLLKLSGAIDALNRRVGKLIMWLVLAAVFISAGNAVMRKSFSLSSNALLEIQWYLFSGVFLLGAGYTFLKNAHVRIDFVSSHLSRRMRSLIDILGIIFVLTPLCWILIDLSWPLFIKAWQSGETSPDAGGLIRWPAYLLVPLGMTLLLLQSGSELIKRVAFLRGLIPDAIDEGAQSANKELEEFDPANSTPVENKSSQAR